MISIFLILYIVNTVFSDSATMWDCWDGSGCEKGTKFSIKEESCFVHTDVLGDSNYILWRCNTEDQFTEYKFSATNCTDAQSKDWVKYEDDKEVECHEFTASVDNDKFGMLGHCQGYCKGYIARNIAFNVAWLINCVAFIPFVIPCLWAGWIVVLCYLCAYGLDDCQCWSC